jgi:ferredoxin-NADP reductase
MQRPIHTIRLVEKLLLSERAQAFHFTFAVEDLPSFEFAAGQFVSLLADDHRGKQQTRAYSIASAPRSGTEANQFDLCVNRVEGGFFSNLLADMPLGGTLQMHGPHGLFTLRQPITDSLLIATGTGVAPMRGFVQWLFPLDGGSRLPEGKSVSLVYGTRHATELYYQDLFDAAAAKHPAFRYLPTLSRADESWQGLRGYVQDHVVAALGGHACIGAVEPEPPQHPEGDVADNPRQATPDSFPIHAYICGLNEMVSANREQLKGLGWHRKQIVFERYD